MLNLIELQSKNASRLNASAAWHAIKDRDVAELSDEAIKDWIKDLKDERAKYLLTLMSTEKDIVYLLLSLHELGRYVLRLEGVEPPTDKQKIGDYLRQVDEVVNESGLRPVWERMKEHERPFDPMALMKAAKEEEERERAEAKAAKDAAKAERKAQEEADKPKGTKPGKVTTSQIKDDGSTAEAASEVTTVKSADSENTSVPELEPTVRERMNPVQIEEYQHLAKLAGEAVAVGNHKKAKELMDQCKQLALSVVPKPAATPESKTEGSTVDTTSSAKTANTGKPKNKSKVLDLKPPDKKKA